MGIGIMLTLAAWTPMDATMTAKTEDTIATKGEFARTIFLRAK
jgi:hypothetical protein